MCCLLLTVRVLCPGDGETHQGIYDAGFLQPDRNIPVFAPANYAELRYWLTAPCARGSTGPARHPLRPRRRERSPGGSWPARATLFDKIDTRPGAKVALVSYGAESEEIIAATDLLLQKKVAADCLQADPHLPAAGRSVRSLGRLRYDFVCRGCHPHRRHRPAAGLCPAAVPVGRDNTCCTPSTIPICFTPVWQSCAKTNNLDAAALAADDPCLYKVKGEPKHE